MWKWEHLPPSGEDRSCFLEEAMFTSSPKGDVVVCEVDRRGVGELF